MKPPSIKTLKEKAKQYYPQSPKLQQSYVEKTMALYQSGRHAFQTGGWNREGYKYECI
jgi:hypothetical protein